MELLNLCNSGEPMPLILQWACEGLSACQPNCPSINPAMEHLGLLAVLALGDK